MKANPNKMNNLIETKLGWCGVYFVNNAVKQIILPAKNKHQVSKKLDKSATVTKNFLTQTRSVGHFLSTLCQYFNGKKVDLKCEIDLKGYSVFEQAVYKVLVAIPRGQVRTYQWVAAKTGRPRASRAVGNALAKNPLPIIIPCHRVIKSDGSLGNFSALGGIKLKEKLLKMENAL